MIAIGIILIIIGLLVLVYGCINTKYEIVFFSAILVVFGCILVGIDYNSNEEPTALDVYRNKTTLQITYQDSIPIDSVVVYKENIK